MKPAPGLQDYLSASLRIRFYACKRLFLPERRFEGWKLIPHHTISYLVGGGHIKTMFAGDKDWRPSRLPGSVCFLPAFTSRQVDIVPGDPDRPIEALWAGFTCTVFGNLDLLSFWDAPFLFSPEASGPFRSVLAEMVARHEGENGTLEWLVMRQRYSAEMVDRLLRISRPRPDTAERIETYRRVEAAVRRIDKDFRQPLHIPELAALCHLSRSQFHHQFKKTVGLSPLLYQQRLRLNEARRLLAETHDGVGEIGQQVGWDNPFHFSQLFRKCVGCSPLRFRNSVRLDPSLGTMI